MTDPPNDTGLERRETALGRWILALALGIVMTVAFAMIGYYLAGGSGLVAWMALVLGVFVAGTVVGLPRNGRWATFLLMVIVLTGVLGFAGLVLVYALSPPGGA